MDTAAKASIDEVVTQFGAHCAAKGQHDLKEIFRISSGSTVEAVTRHCEICGAVVVDLETDARIMGLYVPMRFPRATRVLRALLNDQPAGVT